MAHDRIAGAGGHNLLLMGPPDTGKKLLVSRLTGILPPMGEDEALEAAAVASVAGQELDPATWRQRKLRSPHHTASGVALVGGGCQLQQLKLPYSNFQYPQSAQRSIRQARSIPLESVRVGPEMHQSRACNSTQRLQTES